MALIQCSVLKAGVRIPAIFEHSSRTLLFKKDRSPVGTLAENGLHILRSLSEEQSIDLQLLCTIEPNRQQALGSKANKSKLPNPSAYLSIIIYGPLDLFEDTGKFIEDCDMYLQDPRGCDRNVKYHNPHRLSGLDPDVSMTLDLVQLTVSREKAQSPVDLLAGLESNEFLPHTETPSALRTTLYK
jgi:SWI/SNF-related matrix-associated actin-dependent regulator of chromatin subfamily A3